MLDFDKINDLVKKIRSTDDEDYKEFLILKIQKICREENNKDISS